MNEAPIPVTAPEETPVDDVRCIRCRLSQAAGGDIHQLVAESQCVASQLGDALGLKPPAQARGTATRQR